MGTIDPVPQTGKVHRPERPAAPEPEKPRPLLPPTPRRTLVGSLAFVLGLIIFTYGAFTGVNLLTMGIGLFVIWAGTLAVTKPPKKLCPACRMEIPLEASVCAYCHKEQLV